LPTERDQRDRRALVENCERLSADQFGQRQGRCGMEKEIVGARQLLADRTVVLDRRLLLVFVDRSRVAVSGDRRCARGQQMEVAGDELALKDEGRDQRNSEGTARVERARFGLPSLLQQPEHWTGNPPN